MTDKMREAFETWAIGEGLSVAPYGASYLDEKTHTAWITWQAAQSAPVVGEADCYDAGLLSDFGGGNVEWWQDYIRAELARAHEFYVSQMPTHSITTAELERLRKDEELKASEASIACEALQEIIDLLPGSSVAQAKLIAVAAMTKRAAIAAEGEKE